MHRKYKWIRIKMDDIQMVGDSYYEELVKDVKEGGYRSFSDYLQTEIMFPEIFNYWELRSCDLVRRLKVFDEANMLYLCRLAKSKKMSTSVLIANIVDKYLKMIMKDDKNDEIFKAP